MAPSIVQFGRTRADDQALAPILGGDTQRFFVLAQRVMWGVEQKDLIRVDVPRTVAALQREYPESPAAHAIAAFGLRDHARDAADRAIEQARRLAGSTHPHAYLIPTPDEWQGAKPAQRLECLVTDRVWRIPSFDAVSGVDLARENGATLVRTNDAGLVFINPVPLSDELATAIAELGDVGAIVLQGKGHSRSMKAAAERFPAATRFATRAHRSHPAARHLEFDRCLDDESPSTELAVIEVAGTAMEEHVLFHAPTRFLIAQDLFQANLQERARPYANRVYSFGFGIDDRVGMAGYLLPLIANLGRFQEGLARVERCAPERLVGAHWGMLEGDALRGFTDTIRFMRGLSSSQHKRMVARYFLRQPTFLRDLVRYKLAQKRLHRRA